MKKTVSFYDFERAFKECERDNFSYDGLKALFDYLEELEESTGEEIELDVIALCCEYTEYDNLRAYNKDYSYCESLFKVQELTTVIPINTEKFIIQDH